MLFTFFNELVFKSSFSFVSKFCYRISSVDYGASGHGERMKGAVGMGLAVGMQNHIHIHTHCRFTHGYLIPREQKNISWLEKPPAYLNILH